MIGILQDLRFAFRMLAKNPIAGIFGAIALHQAIASVLFGVQPSDPRAILISAGCLLGVAFLACYIPARRATRVDPLLALR